MKRLRLLQKQTLFPITAVQALVGGLIIAAGVLYAALFFTVKPLIFSYAGQNCIPQLLIAPDIQQPTAPEGFIVTLADSVRVGGVGVFSTKLCVTPTKSHAPGSYALAVAPFGGVVYQKKIHIEVPPAPVVTVALNKGTKIPASSPLRLPISSDDMLHTYEVRVDTVAAPCSTLAGENTLSCDVPALSLRHGGAYTLRIERSIKGETQSTILGTADVVTVDSVQITQSALVPEQVIYTPTDQWAFTTNTPLETASVELTTQDGITIPTRVTLNDAGFFVHLDQTLTKETAFILTVQSLQGRDGGILPEPVVYRFSTSGGPTVQTVSVGTANVGQYERIILTFDQPVVDTIDISKYISVNGVEARIERSAADQAVVTLSGAPLCTPFSITVREALQSASNGWYSEEDWTHMTRITCGYSKTIGYSVQGRPITAHYFGSGDEVFLFTGGIHGSELSSTTTMDAWVAYLYNNAHTLPASIQVVVVPSVNPDGIAAGTRNNAHNVNLARNFPAVNRASDIETATGVLVGGGGTAPGSEPEAAALLTLTNTLKPRLAVSFHAQGSLVGANKYGDSVAIGERYAQMVGYKTMFYSAEAVMGYSITGEYEEWVGEAFGTPAILIELPRLTGDYFGSQRSAILHIIGQ